jgi:hypothetical protein
LGRNSKARGKKEERVVASIVKGWRNPDNGTKVADVENEVECFEVKSRITATPKLITGAWDQAMDAAVQTGKAPWVVLSYLESDRRRRRWLVREIFEDSSE